MSKDNQENIDDLSFEQALSELETIVTRLERGDAELEDSITLYERGVRLKQYCEKKLNSAKLKVDKIVLNEDGAIATEPFDSDD